MILTPSSLTNAPKIEGFFGITETFLIGTRHDTPLINTGVIALANIKQVFLYTDVDKFLY